MKRVNSLLLAVIILTLFTGVVSCGDDSPAAVDPVAAAKEKISKTWAVGTNGQVMYESENRTSDYSAFELTVNSDNTYSTTEVDALDPWPNSGSWSFTDETNITDPNASSFQITRDDELVMTATFSDEGETLTLTFLYDQTAHDGERIAQVDGNWTFVLHAKNN